MACPSSNEIDTAINARHCPHPVGLLGSSLLFRSPHLQSPISRKGVMPLLKNVIVVILRHPHIAQSCSVMKDAVCPLKRNQTNTILDIKLEDVTSVVECLISVGSPKKVFRHDQLTKLRARNAEEVFVVWAIRVQNPTDRVSDLCCIRFEGKRADVLTAFSDSSPQFIERVREGCCIRFVDTISETPTWITKKPSARRLSCG